MENNMLVEIQKTGFNNKGAELMLLAILEKMRFAFPEAKFAVIPQSRFSFKKRAELGLMQKASYNKYSTNWGKLATFIPKSIRDMYGVVLDSEIDVILDSAGFQYGDAWGSESCLELARLIKKWKKNGKKVILLPQAFGPFTGKQIRRAIKSVVENADLIYARDYISFENLTEVVNKHSNIKLAPDFTNLIKGVLPDNFDTAISRFCIIPNSQMIKQVSTSNENNYVDFMSTCAKYLYEKSQNPFLLIHSGVEDQIIAKKISDNVGGYLPILFETNPLKIKGIIGSCRGVISSRYHGLVNALSQNIPAIGTSWSHKYKILFEDYGFDDGLIDMQIDKKVLYKKIDLIIEPESQREVIKIISEKSNLLKTASENMWNEVFEVIK